VSDQLTGMPVASAEVKLIETECVDYDTFLLVVPYCDESVDTTIDSTTTDADGYYVLTDFDDESYTIVVSHPEYVTAREPTPVLDERGMNTLDIALSRQE
jgi:hypothetical protein